MQNFLPALMIVFLISACGSSASNSPTTADLPTQLPPSPEPFFSSPTPVCISFEPTQADIDRALAFTGKLFDTSDWNRTYTVATDKVSVTWFSESLTSVAYLEALIFPCSYEELDLDYYFSVDNWQIVFGNYETYEYVDECRTDDGIRLYQFTGIDQGFEYDIHYWAVNDTDTRVISMMVVMPLESQDLIEEYSYSLFPQIPDC